jgi:GrpB-like predicted nucleotidyltransferase (UPF0157 family)
MARQEAPKNEMVVKLLESSGKFGSKMRKRLSDMSLEELWRLFPIFLTRHQDHWDSWYEKEVEILQKVLAGEQVTRISHVGSTAIADIWAKPIIDILLEVSKDSNLDKVKVILLKSGYTCMSKSEKRVSFNKGYTENGLEERVFHLHARYAGDNDELYFRDYMIEYPALARKYEKLKLSLWKRFEHDRDAYTENKTAFISDCTRRAIEKYGNRYRDATGIENPPE